MTPKVKIYVHERIKQRHPEISVADVKSAFYNIVRYRQRSSGEYIGVGSDANSRLLELVYVENLLANSVLIYHAQTPPTKRTCEELGLSNNTYANKRS